MPQIIDAIQVYSDPSSTNDALKQAEAFLNDCEQSNFTEFLSALSTATDYRETNNLSVSKLALVLLGNSVKIENLFHLFVVAGGGNNNHLPPPEQLSYFASEQVRVLSINYLFFDENPEVEQQLQQHVRQQLISSQAVAARCISRCLLLAEFQNIASFFQRVSPADSSSSSPISSSSSKEHQKLLFLILDESLSACFSATKFIAREKKELRNHQNQIFNVLASKFEMSVQVIIDFVRNVLIRLLNDLLGFCASNNIFEALNDNNNNESTLQVLSMTRNAILTLGSTWSSSSLLADEENTEQQGSNQSEKYRTLAEFARQDCEQFLLPLLEKLFQNNTVSSSSSSETKPVTIALQQLKNATLQVLHEAVDGFSPITVLPKFFSPLQNQNGPASILATIDIFFGRTLLENSIKTVFSLSEVMNNNNQTIGPSFVSFFHLESAMRSVVLVLRIVFSIMAGSGSGCNGPSSNRNNNNNNITLPFCCCLRHAFLTNETLIRSCFCRLVTLSPMIKMMMKTNCSSGKNDTNNNIDNAASEILDTFDLTPSEVLSPLVDMFEFLTHSEMKRRQGFGSGTTREYNNNKNNKRTKSKNNTNSNAATKNDDQNFQQLMKQREREEEMIKNKSNNNNSNNETGDDENQEDFSVEFLSELGNSNNFSSSRFSSVIEEKILTTKRREFLALVVETQKLASVFVSQTMKLEKKNKLNQTSSNLKSWLQHELQQQQQQQQQQNISHLAFALPLCFSLDARNEWITATRIYLEKSTNIINDNNNNKDLLPLIQLSTNLSSLIAIYSPFVNSSSSSKILTSCTNNLSKAKNAANQAIITSSFQELCSEALLNIFGSTIWKAAECFMMMNNNSNNNSSFSSLDIVNFYSQRMVLASLLARSIDIFLSFTVKYSTNNSSTNGFSSFFTFPQDLLLNTANRLVDFLLMSQQQQQQQQNSSSSSSSIPLFVQLLQSFEKHIPLSINPLLCWNALSRSVAISSNILSMKLHNNNNNNNQENSSSSSLIPRVFEALQSCLFSCWKKELGRADVAELVEEICSKFLPYIPLTSSTSASNENNNNILFFSINWLRDNILSELLSAKESGRETSAVAYLTPFAIRIVAETIVIRGSGSSYAAGAGQALFGHLCVSCIASSVVRETAVVQAGEICLANLLVAVKRNVSSSSSSLSLLPRISLPNFWLNTFRQSFKFSDHTDSSTIRIDQLAFATIMSILRPELLVKANNNSSSLVFPVYNNKQTNFFELNIFKLTPLIVQYCDLLELLWESSSSDDVEQQQQQEIRQEQQNGIVSLFSLLTEIIHNNVTTDLCFLPAALGWLRVFCVAPDQLLQQQSQQQQVISSNILKKLCKHALWGFDSIDSLVSITHCLSAQDVMSIVLRLSSDRFLLLLPPQDSSSSSSSILGQMIRANSNYISIKTKKKLRKSVGADSLPLFVMLDAVATIMFGILIDLLMKEERGLSENDDDDGKNADDDDDDDEDYVDDDDDNDGAAANYNNNQQQQQLYDESDDDSEYDYNDDDEEETSLDSSVLSRLASRNDQQNSSVSSSSKLLPEPGQVIILKKQFENWKSALPNQEGMRDVSVVLRLIPDQYRRLVVGE